ncbi:MAG: outer membrane beta-barrel family protein [Flavobacteriaceae bacterium]
MKIKAITIILGLMCTLGFAQKITVSGNVLEAETNQKLEYATIVLKPTDKSSVTGGITNAKGNFEFEIKKGTYHVSVEYISYVTKDLGTRTFSKNTNLGTITLTESAVSLDEIELIAEKSTVEIRLDKKIYNVGKDMTVKGGNAMDVLDNVPSVTVDVEGAVSLRGNDNVRILINGKPSNFSAAEALRQLPADAIKKVEVVTSPSARYDAEGTAGIINIILRKGKAQGLNGSLSGNIKNPTGYGISSNFNWRYKKINVFNTIGFSDGKTPGNAFFENDYVNNTVLAFSKEDRNYDRNRKNFNTRLGMTYSLTDKSSVTGSVSYTNSNRFTDTGIKLNLQDQSLSNIGYSTRNELEDRLDVGIEYNLNFTQKFKGSGHKLTLDYKFETSDDDEFSKIVGEEFSPNPNIALQEKTHALEDNKNYLVQTDYVLPIGENAQFEAGFKLTNRDQETDFALFEEQITGEFIKDTNVSNIFKFKDQTTAFYTQYGNKFGKFSALFGLRLEMSDIEITSQGVDNPKKYSKWFPTLNLAYEIGKGEDITLGYNRRIRRPHAYFLNPFLSRASETNVFQGNPDLNPAYSNGVDLGYLKKWAKVTFNTSLYYNYTTDVFQFIRENTGSQTSAGVPIIRMIPRNIASEDRFGWEFSLDYKALKWLKLNSSFNFYNVAKNGNNIVPNSENNSWNTRFTSRVKLPLKIDWQTTVNYRGPSENYQSNIKGLAHIDLAFSKDLFNENATLSLNVSDLLNSRKRRSTTIIDNLSTTYSEFQWRERVVRLNFTYRFNQKKRRARRSKKSIRFSDDG